MWNACCYFGGEKKNNIKYQFLWQSSADISLWLELDMNLLEKILVVFILLAVCVIYSRCDAISEESITFRVIPG